MRVVNVYYTVLEVVLYHEWLLYKRPTTARRRHRKLGLRQGTRTHYEAFLAFFLAFFAAFFSFLADLLVGVPVPLAGFGPSAMAISVLLADSCDANFFFFEVFVGFDSASSP